MKIHTHHSPLGLLHYKNKTKTKLDGVGPVDNRPSTNKLHHFVQKNKNIHVPHDTWHVTHDMWHVTRDNWRVILAP